MNTPAHLRIIGDVHGKIDWNLPGRPCYLDVIRQCRYSMQVGDMGDAETYAELQTHVDPTRHRFVGGNHEQYPDLPPHHVGDFGQVEIGGVSVFFVRGAYSIDKPLRLRQERERGWTLWWPEEELDDATMKAALDAYQHLRPRFVVTHTAPAEIARILADDKALLDYGLDPTTFTSRTGRLLQAMFDIHPPRYWVFGHFHRNWTYEEPGTTFVCVGELCSVDVDEQGDIVGPPRMSVTGWPDQ